VNGRIRRGSGGGKACGVLERGRIRAGETGA
jgi:hypothetical protein